MHGSQFTWDFIGNLQSRKVKRILPLVRLIHSVATGSVLEQLGRHGGPETEVLVEVNLAGATPPFTEDPEASRPAFARLAELAAEHGLDRLSMGSSQDWEVAVEEGATILRLGTALYR